MDEFQNYEKAFGALSESYKCLNKVKPKNQTEHEDRVATIKARLTVMKKFIQAKKYVQSNLRLAFLQFSTLRSLRNYFFLNFFPTTFKVLFQPCHCYSKHLCSKGIIDTEYIERAFKIK